MMAEVKSHKEKNRNMLFERGFSHQEINLHYSRHSLIKRLNHCVMEKDLQIVLTILIDKVYGKGLSEQIKVIQNGS